METKEEKKDPRDYKCLRGSRVVQRWGKIQGYQENNWLI